MAKEKISEYDASAGNNTDVNNVNIAEGCPPSGINNAIREVMAALKRFQVGSDGDGVTVGGSLVVAGDITVNSQGDVRFADSDSSNYVALQAPATVASNVTFTLPAADGTSGQVIQTNGSGALSFATASSLTGTTDSATPFETSVGSGAGAVNTGVNNTFVGFEAGNDNTTGANNTAVGYQALDANTTGQKNTAVGTTALGANTTGTDNVAVGWESLRLATTAQYNVGVGPQTLYSNTTGSRNTAVGSQALLSNTTGTDNIAVGSLNGSGYGPLWSNTTGQFNVGIGGGALGVNTTASNNTAIGYNVLQANTTGANNVALGRSALELNTTGANNTAVGNFCLDTCTTGIQNTAVGYAALKNLTTGSNNIGLGINGGRTGGSPSGIFNVTTESDRIVIGNDSHTNAYVKVAWTVTSDARDKTNIESVPHGLSFVNQLNPVSYQFRKSREDDTPNGNKRYGFLAQDILALEGDDPVIIDNEQPDHLKYQGEALVPVLVNAIKELKAEVDALKSQINGA